VNSFPKLERKVKNMGVKFLEPLQMQLLNKGLCVACMMPLSKAKHESMSGNRDKVTCKCGRIFVLDKKTNKYRRAEVNES